VSAFLDNARQILDAAVNGFRPGTAPLTILVGWDGTIRLLSESDWPLDSLGEHCGTQMAYRVLTAHGRVQVEGKTINKHCLIEAESSRKLASRLIGQGANQVVRLACAER
jgi:hypothetical protein